MREYLLLYSYPLPHGGGIKGTNLKNTEVLARLKNVEGHIRGIERMVEEDTYCIDIIRQLQAVQAALNKVSTMVLENHLNSCVVTAVRGNDPSERERVMKEVTEIFDAATRV